MHLFRIQSIGGSDSPHLTNRRSLWHSGLFCTTSSRIQTDEFVNLSKLHICKRRLDYVPYAYWSRNQPVRKKRFTSNQINEIRKGIDQEKTKELPIIAAGRIELCFYSGEYIVLKSVKNHPQMRETLRNEVTIHHQMELAEMPVVKMLGFYEDKNNTSIAYEYASKGSLSSKIERTYVNGCGVKWFNHSQKQLFKIGGAIAYMHNNGIVHKDLSCDNILIDEHFKFMLHDFSESCMNKDKDKDDKDDKDENIKTKILPSRLTRKESYISPERYEKWQGAQSNFDPIKDDVWSFGVILVCCFTHHQIWTKPNKKSPEFLSIFTSMDQHLNKIFSVSTQQNAYVKIKLKQLIDMLKHIFVDEEKRFTMDEILDSPFFYNCSRSRLSSSTVSPSSSVDGSNNSHFRGYQ